MVKIDFSTDETSATAEAKDKDNNEQFIEDKATVIKSKFEILLKNRIDIDIKAILFALNGFEQYLTIPNIENDKNFFLSIEKSIKKDLELHSRSNNYVYNDGYWILNSYYVLFFINIFMHKYIIAIRYLLKTFLTDPYIARNNMFQIIYHEYFEPKFKDELIDRISFFPEDPRVYAKGNVSNLMMKIYIDTFSEKKEELDHFINNKCYNIALLSQDNILAYKTIKFLLSLD